MLTMAMAHGAALADQVEAASFLQIIRNAILVFLLIVFLLGGIVGFLIGRAFGRRR